MGRGDPSWHPFVCRSTGLFCALLLVFVCWIFLFLFFSSDLISFFGLFTCADAGVFLPRHFCGFIDSITIALNAFESVRTFRTLWEPKIEKSLKEIRPGKRTNCRWTGPNFSLRFRSKISWPCVSCGRQMAKRVYLAGGPQSTYKGINVLCTAGK